MSFATKITYATALTMLNSFLALLNSGTRGYIELRTGAPPSDADAAASGTLLATHQLQNPAFGAPSDLNPNVQVNANTIADATFVATGTVGHFRVYQAGGTVLMQGTAGTTGCDLIVGNTAAVINNLSHIVSWALTQREG